MKKMLKNKIFICLVLIICGITLGIGATTIYYSNEILYTPADASWNVTNVKSALDDLFSINTQLNNIKSLGNATASDIVSGKKAVVKGKEITGTGANKSLHLIASNITGSTTIDMKTFLPSSYASLTANSFVLDIVAVRYYDDNYNNNGKRNVTKAATKTYDATTGTFTSSVYKLNISGKYVWASYNIYALY